MLRMLSGHLVEFKYTTPRSNWHEDIILDPKEGEFHHVSKLGYVNTGNY